MISKSDSKSDQYYLIILTTVTWKQVLDITATIVTTISVYKIIKVFKKSQNYFLLKNILLMGRTEPREESPIDPKLSVNFLVSRPNFAQTSTPNSEICSDFTQKISGALAP